MQDITLKIYKTLQDTGKKFVLHNCTYCYYPCGWVYQDKTLQYDSGCDCTTSGYSFRKVDLNDLDQYFNGTYGGKELLKRAERFVADEDSLRNMQQGRANG